MTRFRVILFGYQDERKRSSGEPCCTYVTGKGLARVTSFLTRASGGVTLYCIRVRKRGKAERGGGESCNLEGCGE
jgi:hypothetical protein